MFFVALLLLSVAAAASASLRSGGDVCTYHLVYRKYNDTLPPDGIPAFTGTLVLNATGYYATIREYRPFSDACGAGQLRERGLESFSFTHENVTYSTAAGSFAFDGPWFRHQPVGVKYDPFCQGPQVRTVQFVLQIRGNVGGYVKSGWGNELQFFHLSFLSCGQDTAVS